MDFNKKAFGKYIKKKREEKGISRDELAKELNVSYEALTKWENGSRIPDFPTIGIVAAKLGVTVQDIYDNSTVDSNNINSVATTISFILLLGAVLSGIIIGLARINKRGNDNPVPMDTHFNGKVIRIFHGYPTDSIGANQEEYINEYLENVGCDFKVELVGNDTGLVYDEYLEKEKAAGEIIDIEYSAIDDYEARKAFVKKAEAGDFYAIDKLLEGEAGRMLIDGLIQYMTDDGTEEKTVAYLEQFRLADGHIYGIPKYANFSSPYFLYYDEKVLSEYGVKELTGDISDIDKILAKSEDMLKGDIIPIIFCPDYSNDKLFGAMFGFEVYDEYWLLKENVGKGTEAINIFENKEITDWYQRLGELSQDGLIGLSYSSSQYITGDHSIIDLETIGGRSAALFFPGAKDGIGQIKNSGYKPGYDILNIETRLQMRELLCINSKTLYPEECFRFLAMLYYDTDFRRLMSLGPEGVGYKVKEENGLNIINTFSGAKGIRFALGLGNDYLIYQKFDNEDYHMYQEKIYEGNKYAHVGAIGLANKVDLSAVMTEYEACNRIFRDNIQVFYGDYGNDTNSELDKLYKRLVDAGYLKVLKEINRQLGE